MTRIVRPFGSLLILLAVGGTSLTVAAQGLMGGVQALETSDPPFSGTIFIDPDIILPTDPTTFDSLTYAGRGMRTMFDRRVNNWITVNAYLFEARFDDGLAAEVQVNPEFGSADSAQIEAATYAPVIGQLPTALRKSLETVWIHKGVQPFGGGNNNLLIHTGQAGLYEADGILEETLVHESSHTSLDGSHAAAPGWLAAQTADAEFISTYARDFPDREDVAESFLPYMAVRYRSDRISTELANTISGTIPNRIQYFDEQGFDMYPIVPRSLANEADDLPSVGFMLEQSYPNPFNPAVAGTTVGYRLGESAVVDLEVFDLAGRRIVTLLSGTRPAGAHAVTWNGEDSSGRRVPSGLYVVKFKTADYIATKTMIVSK